MPVGMDRHWLMVGAVVTGGLLFYVTNLMFIHTRLVDHHNSFPAGHNLGHRRACSSEEPCHCHAAQAQCLCLFGTQPGPDCIQSTCNWHATPSELHDGGQCDKCSVHHCHGCASAETCGGMSSSCRWVEHDEESEEPHCEAKCSSYHCHGCGANEVACLEHSRCSFVQGELCLPRCAKNACDGCLDQDACGGTDGCDWDAVEEVCATACGASSLDVANGLGCWTCDTRETCGAASAAAGCTWKEDTATCEGSNSDEIGVAYGTIVNPGEGNIEIFAHFDSLLGSIVVEHLEAATSLDALNEFCEVRTVVGNLALLHNDHLKDICLSQLRFLDGDLRIVDNPKLSRLELHEDIVVTGCVDVQRTPLLTEPTEGIITVLQGLLAKQPCPPSSH